MSNLWIHRLGISTQQCYALPSALVDVLSAHGLEGVGAAYEIPVGVVAVLLDDAQVILALPNLLALQEMLSSLSLELYSTCKFEIPMSVCMVY